MDYFGRRRLLGVFGHLRPRLFANRSKPTSKWSISGNVDLGSSLVIPNPSFFRIDRNPIWEMADFGRRRPQHCCGAVWPPFYPNGPKPAKKRPIRGGVEFSPVMGLAFFFRFHCVRDSARVARSPGRRAPCVLWRGISRFFICFCALEIQPQLPDRANARTHMSVVEKYCRFSPFKSPASKEGPAITHKMIKGFGQNGEWKR